jgi:uncharacterized protein (DUF1330 family)
VAGFVVFIREGAVTDPEAMKKYLEGSSSRKPRSDMKVLTVYGDMECIEGESADGIVILEFPDTATAKEWYYSEDYQSRAKYRMQAAHYRGFIIEGM